MRLTFANTVYLQSSNKGSLTTRFHSLKGLAQIKSNPRSNGTVIHFLWVDAIIWVFCDCQRHSYETWLVVQVLMPMTVRSSVRGNPSRYWWYDSISEQSWQARSKALACNRHWTCWHYLGLTEDSTPVRSDVYQLHHHHRWVKSNHKAKS
jgi:hypothetical protein